MFYSLYFVSLGRVPIGIPCKLTEYSDMSKEKEEKLAEISARITKVIAYLGETANSFATKLGYQRAQTIYDIQKKKSAPSYDFFQRFTIAGYSAIIILIGSSLAKATCSAVKNPRIHYQLQKRNVI